MRVKLPLISNFNLQGKRILLRTNYDVPLSSNGEIRVADETRMLMSLRTLRYLLKNKCRVIVLSHLDRPGGKVVPSLSLKPVARKLTEFLPKTKIKFSKEILGEKTKELAGKLKVGEVLLLENLRFDKQEERNYLNFAKKLSSLGDFYINEAFADCHRNHASIVGIPQFLPAAAGLKLAIEVELLSQVYKTPKRPVVIILGGKKQDKLKFIKPLSAWADFLLVGGYLPKAAKKEGVIEEKTHYARLTKTGKDITVEDAQRFCTIIKKSKTIVWNGTVGVFENRKSQQGTRLVSEAVVSSQAFKVAGGGDTEAALTSLGLENKFDFISSGGGAMLEFLSFGDLPGLKALTIYGV